MKIVALLYKLREKQNDSRMQLNFRYLNNDAGGYH